MTYIPGLYRSINFEEIEAEKQKRKEKGHTHRPNGLVSEKNCYGEIVKLVDKPYNFT